MSSVSLSRAGTLIRTRGREWVVLPESSDDLLMVRPVGGLDEEITGILPGVEPVESATFPLPSIQDIGDFRSGQLLREAARLSTRAAAGPFRSFARIAVEPRPYQLVPLMMALRLDPVRLLIADDVGIGKTVEAALVARELLDRGEIKSIAVLCPPHLAEQWQHELAEKFHIEATLVLSGTIQKLERDLPVGVSVFDRHRHVIVSTDFIKTDRRATDFAAKCPEFVIVDEAHGCTNAGRSTGGKQKRFELIRSLAENPQRHLVLVTATPHSGNEEAFRSLLGLLDSEFFDLPADIDRSEREGLRRKLARHLVQRRRADIVQYLETDTTFPERLDKEMTYGFSKEYRELFYDILQFAREFVADDDGAGHHRRVRYWSALALLRCVCSSPAAAAATLRNRAAFSDLDEEANIDAMGRRAVLDQDDGDESVVLDFSPGSAVEAETSDSPSRRRMLKFAQRAEQLKGTSDKKLQQAIQEIKSLLKAGFQPIVFCRFVETATYVADALRQALPARVAIESVTGLVPPAERERRIEVLSTAPADYVLVATDCLSEGINLQQAFNAVLHYDLCWNPTRHEQREGRVDRYGQQKNEVRVITYYGSDNPVDDVILKVLIRKHKSIKSDLGVAVAVPGSGDRIAETIFEGALFRNLTRDANQQTFDFGTDEAEQVEEFHSEWENAREKEKASRSRFAQHSLDKDSVAAELNAVRDAIGRADDVQRFVRHVLQLAGVPIECHTANQTTASAASSAGKTPLESMTVHLSPGVARSLRQAIGRDDSFTGRFELPLQPRELYLGRTSQIVEGLAAWTIDNALDPHARDTDVVAARCGVMWSSLVEIRTVLLITRIRYHLRISSSAAETILCEEVLPMAARVSSQEIQWLDADKAEQLLLATPERNVNETTIQQQVAALEKQLPQLQAALADVAAARAVWQLESHQRVREATRQKGRVSVEPILPVDILGAYILLPASL